MLEAKGLKRLHLGPVDLRLEAGQCTVLRGPSGSGKSLLLRALADLDPAAGTITLHGRDKQGYSAPDWRRRVAYLPAEPGWWTDIAAQHFSSPRTAAFDALGLPADILGRPVSQLSTGERQRLAFLRLLENTPEVILLDEPTAALDPTATEALEAMIRARRDQGAAILLVSHDRAQATRLADRALVLEDGGVHSA